MPDFKPTDGGLVPKTDAEKWIKKYDDEKRKDKKHDTKSVFFGKDTLKKIMDSIDSSGAAGLSIIFTMKYSDYAKKDTDNVILVPTMEDGKLVWASDGGGKDGNGNGWDDGRICPPDCPIQ